MISAEVVIKNKVGIRSKPATCFVQKANEFKCGMFIEKDSKKVNAKSLLGVLSLGVLQGTEIRIIADGVDEEAAIEAMKTLIESNFAE